MTNTPRRAIPAPMISNLSGVTPSICQPQSSASTIKTPPYAAYTLPKFAVCNVGMIPYSTSRIAPSAAYSIPLPSRSQIQMRYPPAYLKQAGEDE